MFCMCFHVYLFWCVFVLVCICFHVYLFSCVFVLVCMCFVWAGHCTLVCLPLSLPKASGLRRGTRLCPSCWCGSTPYSGDYFLCLVLGAMGQSHLPQAAPLTGMSWIRQCTSGVFSEVGTFFWRIALNTKDAVETFKCFLFFIKIWTSPSSCHTTGN